MNGAGEDYVHLLHWTVAHRGVDRKLLGPIQLSEISHVSLRNRFTVVFQH